MDLLDAFRFRENSAVETSLGYCRSREGQSSSDVAYKLSKKAVISVPTATVFPSMSYLVYLAHFSVFDSC